MAKPKKIKAPANFQLDDERFGIVFGEWDVQVELGPPGGRFHLELKDAKRLLAWFQSAVHFMEWRNAENRRIEREEG